uniref:Brix domain-containing protein n=1 Tax=Thermofilum pendens TaxID=2269 RepID=A0A7C1T6Z6_THEPE
MVVELVVSTSRHPTPPVRRLARELSFALWSARRINRGSSNFQELVVLSRGLGARRLTLVDRGLHGNPGKLLFYDLSREEPALLLVIWLRGVVFPEKPRSIKKPVAPLFVASAGGYLDFAEELAVALNYSYIGEVGSSGMSLTGRRLLLVEPVNKRNLAYVLKFLEDSRDLGLKILVKRFATRLRSSSPDGS